MKTISSELQEHVEGEVTALATCWKLTRVDGTVLYFTDHDADVVYDSNTYKASTGYTRSAIDNDASMAVDNLDMLGILDSEEITVQDLQAGLYDYARIELFLINWMDTSQGIVPLRTGWIGEVTYGQNGTFTAELRGLTQALSQTVGELYTSSCRADLGDSRCKITTMVTDAWAAETEYAVGDLVVPTYGVPLMSLITLTNMGAEEGDLTDWSVYGGSYTGASTGANGVTPLTGDYMFRIVSNYATQAYLYRVIALADHGLEVGQEIYLAGYLAWAFDNAHSQLVLTALDASDVELLEVVSTLDQINDTEWYYYETAHMEIPAGCTKLRLKMRVEKDSETWMYGFFDNLGLYAATDEHEGYWPVYFECTTAGTSDATEPDWPEDIGDTVTETGGVEWVAKEHFTAKDFVSALIDNRQFACDNLGTDDTELSNRYKKGVLEWLTGNNAGRVCEVKEVSSDGVALYFSVPNDIAVDDEFRITAGCRKTVPDCRDKFDNILNYRGEPFIPGQDEFLYYPDAK